MKKQLAAFLCVLSLIISLTAFPAAAATTANKLISTKIPSTFPSVKMDPGFTQVSFWHSMTGRNGVNVTNLTNWYNATLGKKKKIYVKSIFQGDYAATTAKMAAVMQSGGLKDLPDVVQCAVDTVFLIKDSKYILYVEDLINADKTFNIKDKLNKNGMWACSYKGKMLGLPFADSLCVLHYNVDAFKLVGLDPDKPPKTFAELTAAAVKLAIKGTGKKPVRYGFSKKFGEWQFATLIPRQKNGTAFQFNNEEGRLGTPTKFPCATDGTLKALFTEYKKLTDTGIYDNLDSSPSANFKMGLTAMYTDSSANYDTIEDYFKSLSSKDRASKVFEHRMASMPSVNADDAIGSALGGSSIFMLNKHDSVKQDATWDFVKFLASVDASAYWYVESGYFPLNTDAYNTKYVQDELKSVPNKQSLIKILNDSEKYYKFQEPYMPSLNNYKNMVADQMVIMAKGKQSIDQTIENISKKTQYILETYADANK